MANLIKKDGKWIIDEQKSTNYQPEEYLSLDNIDVNRITESKFWEKY